MDKSVKQINNDWRKSLAARVAEVLSEQGYRTHHDACTPGATRFDKDSVEIHTRITRNPLGLVYDAYFNKDRRRVEVFSKRPRLLIPRDRSAKALVEPLLGFVVDLKRWMEKIGAEGDTRSALEDEERIEVVSAEDTDDGFLLRARLRLEWAKRADEDFGSILSGMSIQRRNR